MTQDNSPWYRQGRADGEQDAALGSGCWPVPPENYDAAKADSVLYNQGYQETYFPSPCVCDGSCMRGRV